MLHNSNGFQNIGKSRVGRGRQSCCFWPKKIPGEKENVRRHLVVMQQPVLLSPEFGAKSSHILTLLQQNVTVVCGIDCLACYGNFFLWTISLISKKTMSMLLTLLFVCLAFHVLFPERLSNNFFRSFAENFMLFLCRIHREIAPGQIHDPKEKDINVRKSTQLREIL
jgi:hypothetical protein